MNNTAKSKKRGGKNTVLSKKIKGILLMAGIGLLIAALIALVLYLPEHNAKNNLRDFYEALSVGDVTRVTVMRQQAYDSGSFEEITKHFEKTLDDDEISSLEPILRELSNSAKYIGNEGGLSGLTDYRITLVSGGRLYYLYVTDEYAYTLEGALRNKFEDKDSRLYSFLEEIKNAELG